MKTTIPGFRRNRPAVDLARPETPPQHEAHSFEARHQTVVELGDRALAAIQAGAHTVTVDREKSEVVVQSDPIPVGPLDSAENAANYLHIAVRAKRLGLWRRLKQGGELGDGLLADSVKIITTPFGVQPGEPESKNSVVRRPLDSKQFPNSYPSDYALSTVPDLANLPDVNESTRAVEEHIDLALKFTEGMRGLRPNNDFIPPSEYDLLGTNSLQTKVAPEKNNKLSQKPVRFLVPALDHAIQEDAHNNH